MDSVQLLFKIENQKGNMTRQTHKLTHSIIMS